MPASILFKSEVNGTIWFTSSLNLYTARPSCGRTIECANLRAAVSSSGRSFLVLRLVSTPRTMDKGSADSLLKIAIFCSFPSSFSKKFSLCRFATGAPRASVTVTNTFTSFTSTLMVVSGSCAIEQAQMIQRRTKRTCGIRFIRVQGSKVVRAKSCKGKFAKVVRASFASLVDLETQKPLYESVTWMRAATQFASRRSNFLGKWLAISPHRSVFKVLFFPDGNCLFQGVNDPPAGLECSAAVRRRYDD